MNGPDVSLVICTRNRVRRLAACLEYVARQKPSCTWELVAVDNGSSDGTAELLTAYAAQAGFPVTTVCEPVPGLGRARNSGWTAARGRIIAFTDDDCYVAADYIERVREIFADPKIGFAGGRVELFDPMDFPMTIRPCDQPEWFKPRSFINGDALLGANMMFRRRVLEEIGGFDPDFGAGARFHAGEDMDAAIRASFAGGWGLYSPKVVVAHHHGRRATDVQMVQRAYSIGTGACMAKLSLLAETRSIVLPIVMRNWYWLAGKAKSHWLMWEMQGFAGYLAHRLRKRVRQAAQQNVRAGAAALIPPHDSRRDI